MHNALLQNQVKLLPVNDIAKLGNHNKMRHNNRVLYFNQKKTKRLRKYQEKLDLLFMISHWPVLEATITLASGENSSLSFGDELFSWTGQQN